MANFKVGDRVEGNDAGNVFTGTVYSISSTGTSLTVKRDDGLVGSGAEISGYGTGWYVGKGMGSMSEWSYNLTLIKSTKTMASSLSEKFALALTPEPQKSFRKAGITNGDNILTDEGAKIFLTWILGKNADAFKKEIVDGLLEVQKEETK